MKFIFIVQGEGRGHMTQAISLYQILTSNEHEVSHVIVGKSKRRELPKFFIDNIYTPITQLDSPNFVTDKKSKSVIVLKTFLTNIVRFRVYLQSIRNIDKIIKQEHPDKIINFYDFLGGLYFLLRKPKVQHIALAHQFLLNHSEFEFPKGKIYDRFLLLIGNRLAGYKASKLLCLSFRHMKEERKKRLHVVPPLLREEIKQKSTSNKDFFLVYMVNHGYSEQVKEFHTKYPKIPIHCFWDKKDEPSELKVDETLIFHRLDDKKFMEFMCSCKGYLTTAGFESVCEAMYFGKPVLMVPVRGHYEQSCNALDASRSGAGISSNIFDLDLLLEYLPKYKEMKSEFRLWCAQTEQLFLDKITEL
ncbi:MAG: glycosyltransferase family protein [Bacteroidota bacterium]